MPRIFYIKVKKKIEKKIEILQLARGKILRHNKNKTTVKISTYMLTKKAVDLHTRFRMASHTFELLL